MPVFPFLIAMCFLTVVRLRRAYGRRGHWLDFAAPAALLLFCWPPVAWLAMLTLEGGYRPSPYPQGDGQWVVVLGANLYPSNPTHVEAAGGLGTEVRAAHAAWLFHHWRPLPTLVSGGPTGEPGDPTLAELMKRRLIQNGVPEPMVAMEGRSLNTFENAVFSGEILRARGARRIVLVTEAYHMERAARCFRRQGFEVTPAPAAFRTFELKGWREKLLPNTWAIRNNVEAIHEWLGLAAYKLRGRI